MKQRTLFFLACEDLCSVLCASKYKGTRRILFRAFSIFWGGSKFHSDLFSECFCFHFDTLVSVSKSIIQQVDILPRLVASSTCPVGSTL